MSALFLVVLACGLLAAGAWWWQAGRTQARVAAVLPALPALDSASPLLRDRLMAAEARGAQRLGASRGLGELGRIYHANGFLGEAVRCYRGLQELEPREPRWPHLLATILAGYGDMEPALALWRRVEELAPGRTCAGPPAPRRLPLQDQPARAGRGGLRRRC